MRPNCVNGSAPGDPLLRIRRAAHTHSSSPCRAPAESRSARSRPAARRPPPRSFPARRTAPASGRSHRRPASADSSAGPRSSNHAMKAAVQLHQLAEVRLALAPPPMRTALPRATPQPRRQHPPPQRFVIDRQPVFTRQMLGRQRRPKALVDRRRCTSPGSAPAPASRIAADVARFDARPALPMLQARRALSRDTAAYNRFAWR